MPRVRDGALQPVQHVGGAQSPIRPKGLALPRVLVENGGHAQGPAAHQHVARLSPLAGQNEAGFLDKERGLGVTAADATGIRRFPWWFQPASAAPA